MMPSTATVTALLNQRLVEEGQDIMVASHMGIYFQPSPLPHSSYYSPHEFHHSMASSTLNTTFSPLVGPSDQKSSITWSWGEVGDVGNKIPSSSGDELLNISQKKPRNCLSFSSVIKMKKVKARKKMREPRFCFKTLSEVDVLDDGYKWRKYGQKVVKNTHHPRSYYRCVQDSCRVKKRVERLAEDPRMVITTYEGRHAHSPPHDEEEQQAASHTTIFW